MSKYLSFLSMPVFARAAIAGGLALAIGMPVTSPAFAAGSAPSEKTAGPSSDAKLEAERVQALFAERFPGMPVDGVVQTPYGMYEIQVGGDLVYTDADVTWLMQGPLIDTKTRKNVSAQRMAKLSEVDFSTLPKDLAIKQVKGDGSRQIAIFEDPNCGYCKQLRKSMEGLDNVTVYTYLFPILSDDSTEKSRNIWCAKDPGKAWDDWMLRNKAPASATCDAPIEAVLALGKTLMVRGTPAIFFEDGSRSAGALPLDELKKRL